MGEPIGSDNVATLRKEMKDGQDALRREFKADEKRIEDEMKRSNLVIIDNDAAVLYAMQYMGHLNAQMLARAHMLEDAIRDFNKFLLLPETSSVWGPIWDAAWTVLATVMPALRLTAFIKKIEEEAQAALKAAQAAGITPKNVHKILGKVAQVHDITAVVSASNEIRDKSKKALQASRTNDFNKLDATKTPVREMIQAANKAWVVFDTQLATLAQVFANRLLDPSVSVKESMLDMAMRLLPLPDLIDDHELELIGRLYLWNILSGYTKKRVKIIRRVIQKGYTQNPYESEIEGLNDNQQDQIMAWFGRGFNMTGGRIPPVYSIWDALDRWGVPVTTVVYGRISP